MSTVGAWTLLDMVGRGAAATVWRATDFTRTVTLKLADANDEKARQSLVREARILGRLDHPNLPRLIDVIDDPPALVIDTPPTKTYGDLLAQGQLWSLPLRQRLATLSVIAAALDRLHEQRILHRDVKPAHLTVTDPPLLFDFGIAQADRDSAPPDVNAGTAAYMPPPGEPVSAARDAYAFGVTAYELLFGSHPLLVAADRDIAPLVLRERAAAKIRSGTWRRPSSVPVWELPPDLRGADLPALDALFAAALGEPAGRPASLSAWMDALRAAAPTSDEIAPAAPDVMPEVFSPAHTAQEVAAALRTDSGGLGADWRPMALLVLGGIAVLVVLVLILLR